MIEIKNLNKSYGDLRVLNDISVNIKKLVQVVVEKVHFCVA